MSETRTILLVDDDPLVTEALRRALQRDGYRLLRAPGGDEAIALLEQETVDVIVSDIDMPYMNGLELLAQVRERWPAVVRIVLTGGTSLDTAIGAINQGEVHRYLTKPWSNDLLRETMRATVARLHELQEPARAEVRLRAQDLLRRELEVQYPGILEVAVSQGAYVIDDERLGNVLRAMSEASRACFQASSLASIDDVTRVHEG